MRKRMIKAFMLIRAMKTKVKPLTMLSLIFVSPSAFSSDEWSAKCYQDPLTNKKEIYLVSSVAEAVQSPSGLYSDVETYLYINIFPNGSVSVAIRANYMNLVGGVMVWWAGASVYELSGKFSPSNKLETYSVIKESAGSNAVWFGSDKRTYKLILESDSFIVELPYYSGRGIYKYTWDKEALKSLIDTEKKSCFK